jgi:hypothetical protein
MLAISKLLVLFNFNGLSPHLGLLPTATSMKTLRRRAEDVGAV